LRRTTDLQRVGILVWAEVWAATAEATRLLEVILEIQALLGTQAPRVIPAILDLRRQ
jgi:hypothetical protein